MASVHFLTQTGRFSLLFPPHSLVTMILSLGPGYTEFKMNKMEA